MGRLFWKFFFFLWLAQLTTAVGVGVSMWLHGNEDHRPPPASWVPLPSHAPPPDFYLSGDELDGFRRAPPYHPPPDIHLLPRMPLLAGALVSLLFAAWLSWYFSRPIRALHEAFAAAANGNLDQHLGSAMGSRKDELADLGYSFDAMTGRLDALLKGQRSLLHDVSHELRSPLARLQAIIGLVRQKPEQQEYLMERLERESVRIDQLIGELLTLARLENGIGSRLDEAVDLNVLVDEVVEDARLEVGSRQIVVDSCQPDTTLWVRGNPELLYRALGNVVRNAIKYSPAESPIEIALRKGRESKTVELVVSDSGPGVAEGDRERIFQPFYRGDSGVTAEGHGLGLPIARQIAESHGGVITVCNRTEGGLSVSLSLPLLAS